MLEANDRELSSLRDTLLGANRELDLLRNHKRRLENELSDVLTRSDAAASALSQKDEEIRRLVEQQRDAREPARRGPRADGGPRSRSSKRKRTTPRTSASSRTSAARA